MPSKTTASSSFTTKKVNRTTYCIREADVYKEHPLIYVKIHPKVPLIIISDTGCDEPDDEHKNAKYTRLREYIEHYPIPENGSKALNEGGTKQYYIICTHCHYDHIGGIGQFLPGGTTEIIASSSGRDFIESDLETHGEFKYIGIPVPWYKVTHYVSSFERLQWPIWHDDEPQPYQTDLNLSIIHAPGHTPDELAWYDHDEMHLSCGDSFYEEGSDGMPIIFTSYSSLVEWVFSMQKLLVFVRSENARAAERAADASAENEWVEVAKRVKVSCAHQTMTSDGEEILARLEKFAYEVFNGKVPIVKEEVWHGEACYTWRENQGESKMSIMSPARLMDDARRFFNLHVS